MISQNDAQRQLSPSKLPPVEENVALKLIGQGTNSKVFACMRKGNGNDQQQGEARIVLKCVHHRPERHERACENLRAEYEVIQQLEHANIVRVYQFDKAINDHGVEFCSMQLENCATDLYRQMKADFPVVKGRRLKRLLQQCTIALQFMHEKHQVGHFDLKPENIGISKHGNAKLFDFGFSFCYKEQNEKLMYKLWNGRSRLYMSPEVLEAADKIEQRKADFSKINWEKVDVFALGVTFFSAYFFKSPFQSGRAERLDKHYALVCDDKYREFWEFDEQVRSVIEGLRKQEDFKTQELSNLLWSMIRYDPSQRATLQQVLEHPFFS